MRPAVVPGPVIVCVAERAPAWFAALSSASRESRRASVFRRLDSTTRDDNGSRSFGAYCTTRGVARGSGRDRAAPSAADLDRVARPRRAIQAREVAQLHGVLDERRAVLLEEAVADVPELRRPEPSMKAPGS
jgi:hypothetical protein